MFFFFKFDSTQDIGATDQATICLRYLNNTDIKERLFAVVKVEDSTGKSLYELLKICFDKHDINFKNIIGESFDGASNMKGEFNGLQSFIKQQNENSIYIWCYAHIINLCVCDTCDNLAAKNLFGFLNRLSTFFSDSYKRMDIWKKNQEKLGIGSKKLRKLQKIGETRWWSREKALKWVFDGEDCLYPTIVSALDFICSSKNFDQKTIYEATSLKDKLCEFQVILTAHLFLKVFDSVGHTSKYLQSSNLDLLAGWLMVENTIDEIGRINFDKIIIEAEKFSQKMNDKFTYFELNDGIIVEDKLPLVRSRQKKRNYDEMCSDEPIINPIDKFRIQVFQCTIDQLRSSFIERFSSNREIIADIQYLLPKNFQHAKDNSLPESALKMLSKLSSINHQKLVSELNHFSKIYDSIVKPLSSNTSMMYNDDNTSQDNQECEYDDFSLDWDEMDLEVTSKILT